MDAKSKADFINSVANGETVPCPVCNAANGPDAKFCVVCGTKLTETADTNAAPAFEPIPEYPQDEETIETKYVEAKSVFADGLPSWDIVPPQVVVRRR